MTSTLFPNGMLHYIAGGLLLGAAISLLFVLTGKVGGMSTVFSSTLSWVSRAPNFAQARFLDSRIWRLWYAAGLIAGALLFANLGGNAHWVTSVPWPQLLAGGFLIGFGARLSNGCTAGHGICGMASLQVPSILAVVIFLATAILTAHAVRALGGAA